MPTFLSLPRELRDQIYTYLLVSPPRLCYNRRYSTYKDCFQTLQLRTSYSVRSKNLGLFRVNQQIHDEASEIFYKRNLWPIRIVMARECAQPLDCRYKFHVAYEAPWEEVAYGVGDDGSIGKFYDAERFFSETSMGELEAKQVIMGFKPDLYPAPRYRKFLRNVGLEILDFRVVDMEYSELWGENGERFIAAGRTMLLPFMGRFKTILGSAEKAMLNIKVNRYLRRHSELLQERPKLRSPWGSEAKTNDPVNGTLELMGDILSLETIWPLTKGGWDCQIDAGLYSEESMAWGSGVLERCGRHRQFKRKRMIEFEEAAVAGDCYFAIVRRRVKLMRNGMRYSCCYGCDQRGLEEARASIDAIGEPVHRGWRRGM